MTKAFKIGDHVVDASGFRGVIANITETENGHWYDVRFASGVGVRFEEELALAA